jgi:hypothetical protein
MRQDRRKRRRTELAALEQLEGRELMAFSTLGYSLPQLVATGEAGPRASWGGPLEVSVYLQNIGASTTTEPLAQAPGATSQADAQDSTVAVLLTPHPNSLKGAYTLGEISAPPVSQNNIEQLTDAFTLPSRPKGFAGAGGKFYVRFVTNSNDALLQANSVNTVSAPVSVLIAGRALPEVRVTGFYVSTPLQQGDAINASATVENFGTAPTSKQGPLEVALVLSTEPYLTVSPDIIATQTIANIPAVSQSPTRGNYKTFAQRIVNAAANVVGVNFGTVTLPVSPTGTPYYLGIVVDPAGDFTQLSLPANSLSFIHEVFKGSASGLPPVGVVSNANSSLFPVAPSGGTIGNGG